MHLLGAIRFFLGEATRFIAPIEVAVEWLLVALLALLISTPLRWSLGLERLRLLIHRLANRPRLAIAICGLLPIAIRLSMLGFAPVPEPSIHDEFSHLLLGDTLSHGRLSNPTHPMWRHFESIHIFQQPTYSSMYPPGQGVMLAVGQVLFHEPWAGVVIGVGLMGAATCWMMQAWLSPTWALFGTLVMIIRIGVAGPWMNSYLGGAVAAIGGALLIGSAARLRRDFQATCAALFGLGLVILMNTRPFEGAVLGLAAFAYVLPVFFREFSRNSARILISVGLPGGLVVLCGLLFTGYYCWRVTGSPVRLPYQVNRDIYGWPENLGFLPAKKVTSRHQALRDMYTKEINHREIYSDLFLFLDNLVTRIFESWTFFIGPLLTVPLIFLSLVWSDSRMRPLLIFLSLIASLNLLQMVLYPYHLGPVVSILFAIATQAVRHTYAFIGRLYGSRSLYFAAFLPFCLVLAGAVKQAAPELDIPLTYWERASEGHRDARASIQAWLEARQPQQLVIVHYDPGHSPDQEWVYNRADIDNSKVVWARELDTESDAQLLKYFSHREAWLLNADVYPQRVIHYPAPETVP